jgi:RimJ/RimL family protein N-acetyltransferase
MTETTDTDTEQETTREVSLRGFEPGDAFAVRAWFADAETTAMLLEQREGLSDSAARAWVQRAVAGAREGEDRKWAIAVEGLDRAAGFTALYGLDRQLAPEVGILIAPEARGAGVGRRALELTTDRAFGELGAHRLYARILTTNQVSQALFSSLGFKCEGTMRGHVQRGRELIDVELWGLLRSEWRGVTSLTPVG